jgi:hypothetical protein
LGFQQAATVKKENPTMQIATHHSAEAREGVTGPAFVSRDRETDPAVISAARLANLEKRAATKPPLDHDNAARLIKLKQAATLPSLDLETRAAVDTATAAYHLSRQPQTLRGWACHEDGPLRPMRINGRLAWKTEDLRRVLGVA